MKIVTAFVCALIVLAAAQEDELDHTNGQPGCQTQEEVTRGRWRNNWDNTRFWECTSLGQAAVSVRCEDLGLISHLYLDSAQDCVHFSQWEWTPPRAPPSRP